MTGKTKVLAKKFISAMDLPADILFDLSQIQLIGNTEIIIENHKGLQKYTSSLIKLSVRNCLLSVYGKGLVIQFIGRDYIKVKGQIDKVEFEQEK